LTTIAQSGILGFGPSAGKGVAVANGNWYRHKANNIDIGPDDDQRLGPNEVGGEPTPSFPYKAGVMVSGGAEINPRLQNSIGWLLYGALGSVETTSGSGTLYHHEFKHSVTNPSYVPWMGVRKAIPQGSDAGEYALGETYQDCKLLSLVFNLPNDGLITARADWLGRLFSQEQDPTWNTISGSAGWASAGAFESFPSIPISSVIGGYIYEPTYGNLPVVGASVSIVNQPLPVQQEKVYGSPYLEDVTIVTRAVTFDLIVKWKNPDMYRKILTGSASGTTWSATPFTSSLDLLSLSPDVITGTSTHYQLRAELSSIVLFPVGKVTLAGNEAIMQRYRGTAIQTGSATPYVKFTLTNEVAAYTWPTI